jgi:hypothetical protein
MKKRYLNIVLYQMIIEDEKSETYLFKKDCFKCLRNINNAHHFFDDMKK